jgi:hypothetical protein
LDGRKREKEERYKKLIGQSDINRFLVSKKKDEDVQVAESESFE